MLLLFAHIFYFVEYNIQTRKYEQTVIVTVELLPSWAAWYGTWLLIRLAPKGVDLFFFFFFFLNLPFSANRPVTPGPR